MCASSQYTVEDYDHDYEFCVKSFGICYYLPILCFLLFQSLLFYKPAEPNTVYWKAKLALMLILFGYLFLGSILTSTVFQPCDDIRGNGVLFGIPSAVVRWCWPFLVFSKICKLCFPEDEREECTEGVQGEDGMNGDDDKNADDEGTDTMQTGDTGYPVVP